MEKQKFCDELIAHMKTSNPEIKDLKISTDTNLISEGILDSMSLIAMIAFIEELTGQPVDFDNFEMEDAQSLDSLYKSMVLAKQN